MKKKFLLKAMSLSISNALRCDGNCNNDYSGGGGGQRSGQITYGQSNGSNGNGMGNMSNLPPGLVGCYPGCPPMMQLGDFSPKCISALTFRAVLGGGITRAYIADSEGIAAALGLLPGGSTQAFTGPGLLTADNFAKWRQTRALFVGGFNVQSTVAADVQNPVNLVYVNIDGTTEPVVIANNFYNNAINPNQNLINNPSGFVITDNMNLFVTGTAGATITLTLNIIGSAGYVSKPWSRYAIPQGSAVCGSGNTY